MTLQEIKYKAIIICSGDRIQEYIEFVKELAKMDIDTKLMRTVSSYTFAEEPTHFRP